MRSRRRGGRDLACGSCLVPGLFRALAQLQPDQRALGVGQVADDLSQRRRNLAYQRGDGDDLVLLRQARVLHQVDYLDRVIAGEVLFTDLLEVVERCHRLGRLPGGIEAKFPLFGAGAHLRFLAGVLLLSAPRRAAAAWRLSEIMLWRVWSCLARRLDSSSTALNSARSPAICAS